MNCFIIPHIEKFATVIDGTLIGISKHMDYTPYHWKSGDLQVIKKYALTKFIVADRTGKATEVIDADALKGRGVNFATAKRNSDPLTDSEELELAAAFKVISENKVSQRQAADVAKQTEKASGPSAATSDTTTCATSEAVTQTAQEDAATEPQPSTGSDESDEQAQADPEVQGGNGETACDSVPSADAQVTASSKKRRR